MCLCAHAGGILRFAEECEDILPLAFHEAETYPVALGDCIAVPQKWIEKTVAIEWSIDDSERLKIAVVGPNNEAFGDVPSTAVAAGRNGTHADRLTQTNRYRRRKPCERFRRQNTSLDKTAREYAPMCALAARAPKPPRQAAPAGSPAGVFFRGFR